MEKLKLSSILDSITSKRMYENQMLPASCHFSGKNHNFNMHAKFILIEQICHININHEKDKEMLKQR